MDSILSWERWWFTMQAAIAHEQYLLTKNPIYLDFEDGFCRIAFIGAPEA